MLAEVDQQHVVTDDVHLAHGANAFLARPDGPGPHPAIVVNHERDGIVRHTRELAIRFAADGYVALVPNLYFRLPPDVIERHEIHTSGLMTDALVAQDLGVAIDYLKQVPAVDATGFAVHGACATGRYPLIAAAHRPDVAACVIFYGAAYRRDWQPVDGVSDYALRSQAPVLCVYGEHDNLIAQEGILRVRHALEAARRSYHIKVIRGVPHAFLDDSIRPYPRQQGDEAWGVVLGFLARVRSGGNPPERVQWTFEADYAPDYEFAKLQPPPEYAWR
jgi:carboxymethylenebutenolidase